MEAELRPESGGARSDVADHPASDGLTVVERAGDLAIVRSSRAEHETVTAQPSPSVPTRNVQLNLLAVGFMLAGTDILCLAGALFASDALLSSIAPINFPLTMVVAAAALWVVVFHTYRLYATQHLSAPDEFRRVISATSIGVLLLVVVTMGTQSELGRSWIGLTWFLALVFELGSRRIWRSVLYRWRNDSVLSFRTLVVGTGHEARRLGRSIAMEDLGYEPIGFISVNDTNDHTAAGTIDDLVETIRREKADCLFVASSEVDTAQMGKIRRAARVAGAELRVSANLPDTLSTRLSLQPIGDVMAITLRPVRLTGPQAVIKRTFDLILAGAGLIVMAPLAAAIAVAVKMTSPGPVLFKQRRVTSGGRTFTMYKFRTMVQDADRLLDEQEMDKSEAFFKLRVAPPVTKVGRLLRKFSLDELPQLWNIVKGDMSLVGPRPLPVEQVAANLELLEYRHEVRAGLTGWWQINGRSDLDPEAAVRMDLFYIENWSPALDLYIVLKTLGAFIKGKGAY